MKLNLIFSFAIAVFILIGSVAPHPTHATTVKLSTYEELIRSGKLNPPGKIMQVDLFFDQNANPKIHIDRVIQKNGYLPNPQKATTAYQVQVINSSENPLYSQDFDVPSHISGPPPLNSTDIKNDSIDLTEVSFALTIPYFSQGTLLRITSTAQPPVDYPLTGNFIIENNSPKFDSIRGDELQKTLLKGLAPPVSALGDGYLDVAIISNAYTDVATFRQNANLIVAHALTYEPFRTRASQIYFRYIENSTDLGCYYDSVIVRLLQCNQQLVTSQVNSAGVPYDAIYVLVNNPNYGGSGGPIGVGYNGFYAGPMYVHEFMGHTVGGLRDEYYSTSNGFIDNRVHGVVDFDGNCFAGTPPAMIWIDLIPTSEYFLGCYYANWFRSSASSVMYTLESEYFNFISQKVIGRRLDSFVGIVSAPPGDADYNGVVNIYDLIAVISNIGRFVVPPLDQYVDGQENSLDFVSVRSHLP